MGFACNAILVPESISLIKYTVPEISAAARAGRLGAAEHARGEESAAREALERLRALDPALANELEGSWR